MHPIALIERQARKILMDAGCTEQQVKEGVEAAITMHKERTYQGAEVRCCVAEAMRVAGVEVDE